MNLPKPLAEGRLIKRYKRFFADIELGNGEIITAHVPNTGSLKGCLEEGSLCILSVNDDPRRKLKYTLQLIRVGKSWVGVNTSLPNQLVEELFHTHPLPHWQDFKCLQREVKITPQSRIDLRLSHNHTAGEDSPPAHFIEVKNVTLAEGTQAKFPDAPTERGQKHLLELMALVDQGQGAEMVYVIQRQDCQTFSPADAIDPKYGQLLRQAAKKGVRVTALPTEFDGKSIWLKDQPLETIL